MSSTLIDQFLKRREDQGRTAATLIFGLLIAFLVLYVVLQNSEWSGSFFGDGTPSEISDGVSPLLEGLERS